MRGSTRGFLLLLIILFSIAPVVAAVPPPRSEDLTGAYIVKLKGKTPAQLLETIVTPLGGEVLRVEPEVGLALIAFPEELQAFGVAKIKKNPRIQYIEPEIRHYATLIPNDPLFPSQWNFQESGFGIKCPSAWEVATGVGVTVAVLDTGVRRDTPDLQNTILLPGFNSLRNNGDSNDDNGHGTHVTGTIAQSTDNALHVAGIAFRSQILPVKVLDRNGSGTNLTVAIGIRWAADHGARVINMSLGGGPSLTLRDAVRYAVGKNVSVVAAAGNSGGTSLAYPAAYTEVIAVGALTRTGVRASFSQRGINLAVMAPGVSVQQQTINPSTGRFYIGSWSGTSMATPHVAGVIALMIEVNPGLTPARARDILQRTARDLGVSGKDNATGYGLIDAFKAVTMASGAVPGPPIPPIPPVPPVTPGFAQAVFQLMNDERAREGVAPLLYSLQLESAAVKWCERMARERFFAHQHPDGSNPLTRIRAEGYFPTNWGENIAAGYQTPEAVMTAWMASPGHRANILNPFFREVGVGFFDLPGSPYRFYWTQDFGTR